MRLRLCFFGGFALSMGALGTGCGPASYVSVVTRDASRTLAEAGAHGAAQRAPYEWTSAILYLDRARELAGYARWQDALVCGRRASTLAHSLLHRDTSEKP